MIRIVTDTGSDITHLAAASLGLESIELDVRFDDFPYDYRKDTDFSVFYDNLTKSKNLPTTSQVTPAQYLDIFNDAKEKGDEVLVVTISSGLSGTYSSAVMAKETCGYDAITLVDSRQCSITQRMMVEHAVKLRDEGKSRTEIAEELESLRDRLVFIVMLDTLTYLKKGGRVPPAMAVLGGMLKIKPTVIVRDGKVEPLKKARGFEAGKQALWTQFEADGYDEAWPVCFGYSQNRDRGEAFMKETREKFGLSDGSMFPVGGVIGTHAGPNAIGVGYVKKK